MTESGSAPESSWWSNGVRNWSSANAGIARGEGQRVEAVVPAPHLVHPVLRHQHRLAAQEPARRRPSPTRARRRPARRPGSSRRAIRRRCRRTRRTRRPPRRPASSNVAVDAIRGAAPSRTPRSRPPSPPRRRRRPPRHRALVARAPPTPSIAQLAAQRRDPVAATGLVRGEDRRPVDRVEEEVGAGERRQHLGGVRDAQVDAVAAQPHGVEASKTASITGGRLGPREHRRRRRELERHPRADPLGHQPQHRVHPGLVRDQVEVVAHGVQRDDRREVEPRAPAAERDLAHVERAEGTDMMVLSGRWCALSP